MQDFVILHRSSYICESAVQTFDEERGIFTTDLTFKIVASTFSVCFQNTFYRLVGDVTHLVLNHSGTVTDGCQHKILNSFH